MLWVRVAFLLPPLLGGFGVALYAGLWLVLPADAALRAGHARPRGATRQGKRPGAASAGSRTPARRSRWRRSRFGVALLVEAVFGGALLFWPLLLGVVGSRCCGGRPTRPSASAGSTRSGRIDPVRVVFGGGGWAPYARLAAGVGLLVAALVLFAVARRVSSAWPATSALAAVLGVVGLGVVVGPWVSGSPRTWPRSAPSGCAPQERADVAAHLHDSVLQTLALIQKNADDARTVARLARAQERDLRSWLYRRQPTDADTSWRARCAPRRPRSRTPTASRSTW